MKYCNNCGTYNEDTAYNCTGCGAALNAPTAPVSMPVMRPAAPAQKISAAAIVSIVMAVLLVAGIALTIIGAVTLDNNYGDIPTAYVVLGSDGQGLLLTESDVIDSLYPEEGLNAIEGAWLTYDGTALLEVRHGLGDEYYIDCAALAYLSLGDENAEITMSEIEKTNAMMYEFDLTMRSGSRKMVYHTAYNSRMMMLFTDDGSWIALVRGEGEYNLDLARQLVGKWELAGKTFFEFKDDSTGTLYGSPRIAIDEWYVVDDYLVVMYEDGYDIFCLDMEDDTLTLSYFTYAEGDELKAEWFAFDMTLGD